jgi:hypothetical protein
MRISIVMPTYNGMEHLKQAPRFFVLNSQSTISSGVMAAIIGKGNGYLHEVSTQLDSSTVSLGTTMGWIVFAATLGGSHFVNAVSKKLLKFA